jgi:hypothetical protein
MRSQSIGTVLGVCASLAAGAVLAQTPVGGSSVLEVRVRDRKIVSGSNRQESALGAVNKFEWRKGAQTRVVIVDQNPLLFVYDAKTSTAETDQHKIATDFGKSLSAFLSAFPNPRTGGGIAAGYEVEGLDVGAFLAALRSVQANIDELPALVNKAAGSATDVASVQSTVANWNVKRLADRVTTGYGKVIAILTKCLDGKPLSTNAAPAVMCADPLYAALTSDTAKALRDREVKNATGNGAINGKGAVGNKGGTKTSKTKVAAGQTSTKVDTTTPNGKLPQTPSPITRAAPPKPGGAPLEGPWFGNNDTPVADSRTHVEPTESVTQFFLVAQSLRANIEQQLALLKTFSGDVAAINTPKALADVSYGLDSGKVEVIVTAASQYDTYLDANVKAARDAAIGKYMIILTPYTPARISLAAAAIVYFPGDRKYTAVPSGSAFTVGRTESDYGAFTVAAMLDIVPNRWAEPTLGGAFQLGVSPVKDRVGFYGGASLRVQQVFAFGAGFAWQQSDRLVSTLSEGQTIATEDALKTEKRFGPAFYLNVSIK